MKAVEMGDHALLVEVQNPQSALAVRRMVLGWLETPSDGELARPVDVVPAARTVLLSGLPGRRQVVAWQRRLRDVEERNLSDGNRVTEGGTTVTLDTTYDGADLSVVAEAWGCSRDAVIDRHTSTRFLVAFCGFAPGFAYCEPQEPWPEVPRRSSPRERVPAGSVALAGEYCGVYPSRMPGGWQLVGRTDAVLFDADRPEPALLVPGDPVRFRAMR